MLNVAIVDDEAAERQKLQSYLQEVTRQKGIAFCVDEFSSADVFLVQYRQGYDLIFLDIEFPHGKSGMDAARALRLAGGMNFYITVATALYAITCCVLALFFEFFLYYNLRKENEHNLFQRIHEEERRQYEISRENAEILGIKSHDLKHKLVALEGRLPQGEIDSMRRIIDTYDSIYHTGSEVLDIILNEKNLRCRGKGISITCMGSGKALDFLDSMDAYSLFGNLLENAIAAAEQLEETGKRIISMVIEQKGNLVSVNVMNFFQGTVPLQEDGLPCTSKQEGTGYHGYGLKSVRAIARKYKGDLTIHIRDEIFTAQVYLQREENDS